MENYLKTIADLKDKLKHANKRLEKLEKKNKHLVQQHEAEIHSLRLKIRGLEEARTDDDFVHLEWR